VVSDLSHAVDLHAQLTAVAQRVIRPALPLRLYGLETHSGYSTVSKGFWPFGLSAGVIDRVRALEVVERRPTLQYLPVNAPEAVSQIVSGLYDLEDNRYRWMARTAVVTLKSPAAPAPLEVSFTIPGSASARRVTVRMDGHEIATQTYPGPGTYTLSVPARPTGAYATVEIEVDRTFTAPPDRRDLGIVITAVGFPAR